MTAITIDTLAITKKLRKHGYTQEQAEIQAEILADVVESNLVTKQDLKELEYRLIFKLTSVIIIALGVFVTLVKLPL